MEGKLTGITLSRRPPSVDSALVLFVISSYAEYVFCAIQNPFMCVKGSKYSISTGNSATALAMAQS